MPIIVDHTRINNLEGKVEIKINEEFNISRNTQESFNEEFEEAYNNLQAVIEKYKI